MQYNAFVSYARKDGIKYAKQLDDDFCAAGLRAWRDRRNLDPDQDYTAELEEGIESSKCVVCCITPDTRRKDSFVRREIQYALAVHRPIVPLIFEDTIPPIHIVNVTREDFTHTPWSQAFTNLLARLRRMPQAEEQRYTVPPDPFRNYLDALFLQIVKLLKHTVFSEIALFSDEAEGAVSKRVRTALPLGFWEGITDEYPSKEEKPNTFHNFGQAFSHYGQRVLLLGAPGAGKTTTLLAFARDRVAERLHDPSAPLPIIAQIRTWDSKPPTPMADWLALQIPMLNSEAIASQIRDNSALLMLDGLDELRSVSFEHVGGRVVPCYPRARFLAIIPAAGPIIVSCRSNEYAEIGVKASLTGAVTLKALSDEQIRGYLREMPSLLQAVENDPDLRDLARTPLLLSILTRAYQDNASALIALSNLKAAPRVLRERVFDAYVISRFHHEKKHAHAALPFSIDDIYRVLGKAVLLNTEVDWSAHNQEGKPLEVAISLAVHNSAEFLEQTIRLHLLLKDAADRITFIHGLLRNYFGFRYALSFLKSAEFRSVRPNSYRDENLIRMRTLQFLATSEDDRAWEALLEQVEPYVDFPLVYHFRIADPRLLLAYARSLLVDLGHYAEVVSEAASEGIGIVANKLGLAASAKVLASAAQASPRELRAAYVFALGYLRLGAALDAIVSATQDEDPTVRGCAAYALAAIGKAETASSVEHLLDDEHVVRTWLLAPWEHDARVKDIANAALRGGGDPWRGFMRFPTALYEQLQL
jgi:hypothetical protein